MWWLCVLLRVHFLGEVSGGAKGIAWGRPVTCKVELNLWRMSPISLGWQLFTEKTPVWLRYLFFFSPLHPFFLSIPFATLHEKKKPYFSTDMQTFLCLSALTKSFVWTEMSACRIKLPVPFCCCRRCGRIMGPLTVSDPIRYLSYFCIHGSLLDARSTRWVRMSGMQRLFFYKSGLNVNLPAIILY